MKILLATDGSAYSKAAVNEVASRPFPPKTEVRIITVIDTIALARNTGAWGAIAGQYEKAENSKLSEVPSENAAKVLGKKNPALIITTKVIDGSPKNIILEEAELWGADLIVIGSHGYGAIERFLLGSVSHAVSLYATCSVEIVRIKK